MSSLSPDSNEGQIDFCDETLQSHQTGTSTGTILRDPTGDPSGKDQLGTPFCWRPPDLSVGSEWYRKRTDNLRHACSLYPEREDELLQAGLEMLDVHRRNYNCNSILYFAYRHTCYPSAQQPSLPLACLCGHHACGRSGQTFRRAQPAWLSTFGVPSVLAGGGSYSHFSPLLTFSATGLYD